MTALVETLDPAPTPTPLAHRPLGWELLRAVRPMQWVKNLLVFAAPVAAGVLGRPEVLARCLLAVAAMTLTASGCYLVNDVRDRALDRQHPRKRLRPVACGAVPVRTALLTAAVLLVLGAALAALGGGLLLLAVGAYAVLTLVYAAGLKHVAWMEMGVVAAGFVLRALAGAAAGQVRVSGWFLLVVSAAAVHVVASKRASELLAGAGAARPVLAAYSWGRLRALRRGSAVLLVAAYAGWALSRSGTTATVLAAVSTVPVVAVLVRWMRATERGGTGAPEQVLVRDRVVRLGVASWALTFSGALVATLWGA